MYDIKANATTARMLWRAATYCSNTSNLLESVEYLICHASASIFLAQIVQEPWARPHCHHFPDIGHWCDDGRFQCYVWPVGEPLSLSRRQSDDPHHGLDGKR